MITSSRKEIEDKIISIMREHFLKYSDEVLEKYKGQITKTARWYIGGLPRHIAKAEADDLLSEAKIAFVDTLKTWDPRKGALWPYVSVRLKGAMQDYLRKRGSDPVTGIYEFITSTANIYMAFNKEAIAHEESDASITVESAMKNLSKSESDVLKGYYNQDKTFKEIGKEVNLSESQVSRIAKTATEKLKKALNK
ncbi:MAG: sigma-70 family RNA polymerase sigma factor [bacterium]